MKVNLHVVGNEVSADARDPQAFEAYLNGPDPLEDLLNEFSDLEASLEREILEQDRLRELEIEMAMLAELEASRARANDFIPEETPLERVLTKMRELEESLKYMSFLTHEIEQFGP